MFKRLLLPVDGSLTMVPLVRKCLALGAALGAQVVAVHVVTPPVSARGAANTAGEGRALEELLAQANLIMQQVAIEAREFAVQCECRVVVGEPPWQVILDLAASTGSDLICMGSHGRHGAAERVLGSQAEQVLAHATLPVLIFR